jgi:hypothetical protein
MIGGVEDVGLKIWNIDIAVCQQQTLCHN